MRVSVLLFQPDFSTASQVGKNAAAGILLIWLFVKYTFFASTRNVSGNFR